MKQRLLFGLASVLALLALYTLAATAYGRPAVLPPTATLATTFASLVTGRAPAAGAGHAHPADHVGFLLQEQATLPGALAVSTGRVLFGVGVGGALGVLLGFAMGWRPALDAYLHPVYVAVRSIPPLALITYLMLWLGHGEAHLLVPVVYAVLSP